MNCDVEFGDVDGRVSEISIGRTREDVVLLQSGCNNI